VDFLILLALSFEHGLPVQEPVASQEEALTELLEKPDPLLAEWRKKVFLHLLDLEFTAHPRLESAWALLAKTGGDSDQANLLLFRRRNGLDLGKVSPRESAESALERGLALWGNQDKETCRNAFEAAAGKWPHDPRFIRNLQWLTEDPPPVVDLRAEPREAAWVVLAARHPQD
jgi:hypothetical protein